MKKIGKVIGYRNEKTAVVLCISGRKPRMNAMLIDERMRPTGKIKDVFGPVERPYVRVRLEPKSMEKPPAVGSELFVM